MAKILLRSGCLDDFQAVGDNGQPVFESALQIRETLRLRQQPIVDCLAIPQRNDEGDVVDWYAPLAGKALSWATASDAQRVSALNQLENALHSARELSVQCQQSANTAMQLFGRLLEKTIQFPGANYVYIVNDKPVITFWGFVAINQQAHDGNQPLACLYQTLESAEATPPAPTAEPVRASTLLTDPDAPLLTPHADFAQTPISEYTAIANADREENTTDNEEPNADTATRDSLADTTSASNVKTAPASRLRLWLLPLAAIIIAAVVSLLFWQQKRPAAVVSVSKTAPVTSQPVTLPPLTAALPLHNAQLIVSEQVAPPQTADQPPSHTAKTPPSPLLMDASQVRDGKTRFLDGNWLLTLNAPVPGKRQPVSLRYKIKNNTGTAFIEFDNQVTCTGAIYSGLQQSGTLMIKPNGWMRCRDGSHYKLPEIACKSGNNNVAQCSARYLQGAELPVSISEIRN